MHTNPSWWWLALLAATTQLAACQPRHPHAAAMPAYQTAKFALSAGPCAPDYYPATTLEGRFLNSLGGIFPVPRAIFSSATGAA